MSPAEGVAEDGSAGWSEGETSHSLLVHFKRSFLVMEGYQQVQTITLSIAKMCKITLEDATKMCKKYLKTLQKCVI